jgi:hypothetical protein
LETQSIEAAVKGAVDSIRKIPAVRRRKNVSYAVVVKVGYEEIQKLKDDGYSYEIICKMLSENGALDVNASPKNLCTAFLRETKRRLSRARMNSSNKAASGIYAPAEKIVPAAVNQNNGGEANKTERDKEQARTQTGTVVDTGLGKIIKNTDGSFDY